LALLLLRACVALVCPAMFIWYYALSHSGEYAAAVVREMETPLRHVLMGYLAAGAFLLAVAVVERWRKRCKQAMWDFVFAGLALLCWWLLLPLSQPVK